MFKGVDRGGGGVSVTPSVIGTQGRMGRMKHSPLSDKLITLCRMV